MAKTPLKMLVLAIGGAMSLAETFARSLEPITEDLHSSVFENCGHFILEEQPTRVADELRAFLQEDARNAGVDKG